MKTLQPVRILSRDELKLLREWHPNASIGLCNGAFDLFHVGHLRYLQGAAEVADVLVVAVNSDASVKKSKGPSRPFIPENERLELLAAMGPVDYLHLFDEESVHEVIRALKPNFHIKGTDYTPENVPGSGAGPGVRW